MNKFCPYFKNKSVFDGFNEIIQALGGKPMTEDEFKSADLRMLRSGLDLQAMEAAYRIYELNEGNFLDFASNGNPSILFNQLLILTNNNRALAIRIKSKIYTRLFKADNKFEKDINGEPILPEVNYRNKSIEQIPEIVYHFSNELNLIEFTYKQDNYFSQHKGGSKNAIFFTDTSNPLENTILDRPYRYAVRLNVKKIKIVRGTKEDMHKQGTSFVQQVNLAEQEGYDAVRFIGIDDNQELRLNITVIFDPKKATIINLNNTESKNITKEQLLSIFGLSKKFEPVNILEAFGERIGNNLLSGQTVSSRDVISSFLQQRLFSNVNEPLALILQRHDVPIRFEVHDDGVFAKTVFDENYGSYISIDPSNISGLSNKYVSDVILHELIHSLTVSAIRNPKSKIEKEFAKLNHILYVTFDKLFPKELYNRIDLDNPYYILLDEFEFTSVFMTDKLARSLIYQKAVEQEKKGNFILNKVKHFVNSITRFFINKNVFNSTTDDLKLYEKNLLSYLLNIPTIDKGNISDSQLLNLVYQQQNGITLENDLAEITKSRLAFYAENLEKHNFINNPIILDTTNLVDSREIAKSKIKLTAIKIANMLSLRLSATLASNMPEEYKLQQKQSLESQIQQFRSDQINTFIAVLNLLSLLLPQLLSDVMKLRLISQNNNTVEDKVYRYQKHDNFGVYQHILDELQDLIVNSPTVLEILTEYAQDPMSLENSVVKNLQDIINSINTCSKLTSEGISYLKNIMINNLKRDFTHIGNVTHMPSILDYMSTNFQDIGFDTSSFFKTFGSVDKAKDDGLRSLAYLINTAINKADRLTHNRSSELMELQENLQSGESVSDLYEFDDKGKPTGYLCRRFKYGLLFSDFRQFKKELNNKISRKYGILLDPKNSVAPLDNEEARLEWETEKLNWLDSHCYRKYTRLYYESYNKLSEITRTAKNDIQSLISTIKSKALGKDGFYHYELLSKEDWNTLKSLYIQKRQLSSLYDINGDLKTGESLIIAQQLQQLNKELYGDTYTVNRDTKAWAEARLAKFKECGGIVHEEGNSIRWEYPEDFDWEKFKFWDERNSKKILKSENGKILLFKRIEDETAQIPVYEVIKNGVSDNGKTYEDNKKKINELLAPYRDPVTGDYAATKIPKAIKLKVTKLEKENSKIAHKAKIKNKNLRSAIKQKDEVFDKYAISVYTETYKQLKKLALLRDLEEPGYYDEFVRSTHKIIWDEFSNKEEPGRPLRWFSKIMPRPEYEDEFMETVPGDGWMNSNDDELDRWLDPEFKKYESEGMTMIPKTNILGGRYDNSKAYGKIFDISTGKAKSKTLAALYNKIHDTITEVNTIYNDKRDTYLLPQITGSYYDRISNSDSFWRASLDYIKDGVGIGTQSVTQDNQFGQSLESLFDKVNEFGEMVSGNQDRFDLASSGKRPDGTPLHMIPQYYTRLLDDPTLISKDICGITCEYYKLALRFKYKSQIQDTAETIVDMMYDRNHHIGAARKAKDFIFSKNDEQRKKSRNSYRNGADSNTYQVARKFLDMNLYNIRSNDSTSTIPSIKLGKYVTPEITIHWNKMGILFRAMTVAINLGMNAAVAGTGFFTALFSHWVQACSGQHYGVYEASYAGKEVVWHFIKNGFGARYIGNKNSKDLIMVIMEHFDIANQGVRKYEHSNRNRMFNMINNNWCFGMLTGLDFIIKSQISVSTLLSFRLYNGHFITEEDLRINNYKLSTKEYGKVLLLWKKGVNLYSVLKVENGKLTVDKLYEEYFKEIEPIVHARMLKYTEAADGMATETQKAAITTSFIGSCILMHRQYFPLMLQERLGEQVYDPDTQLWSGGIYRGAIKDLFGLGKALFFGVYDNFVLLQAVDLENKGLSNRLKLWYRGDTSSIYNYQRSRLNRRLLRQVVSEIIIYNTVVKGVVAFLTYLASKYKDKNKWDYKLIMLLLYIAHRTQWESMTPYRLDDALNNFKSVAAATGTMDKFDAIKTSLTSWIFPQSVLFDTFYLYFDKEHKTSQTKYNPYVQKGVYSDNNIFDVQYLTGERGKHPWLKLQRDVFKVTPMHNLYEQWYGSDQKDRYYVNQIMEKK